MKTYYRVNELNKRQLLRNWKKGQAIWRIGSKVLITLSILCVFSCVGIYLGLTSMVGELNKSSSVSIEFIAVMLAIMFALITGVILQYLFLKIHNKAISPYYKLTNECVYMKEDKLIIVSHNKFSKDAQSIDEYCIPYDKIKELHLNELNKLLTIKGQIDRTYYIDYSLGKVGRQWLSDKDGEFKLLLYYENENIFLEGLINKTKLHLSSSVT